MVLNQRVAGEPFFLGVQINRDDHRFLMYERWHSEAYFKDDHQQTEHLQAFMAELPPLLDQPLDVSFLRLVEGFGEFDEASASTNNVQSISSI